MILGGGQQKGMRSGTDNVPGIAGLGVAAKKIYEDFDEKIEQLKEINCILQRDFRNWTMSLSMVQNQKMEHRIF